MRYYKSYVNTNIEWVNLIPSHWRIVPLKKYLSGLVDYRGKTPKKIKNGVFLVTAKNIRNGQIDYEASKEYINESDYPEVMSRGIPKIGDVLLTTEAPLGEVANVDNINIALAQRVIKLRGNKKLDNYFLKYFISSHGFQSHIYSFATGSTALGIKGSRISGLKMVLPPINEQRNIVVFLNQKVTEINDLIADKEKLIKLLEEKRQAVITKSVTKGIDPQIKMKDSGFDLIGDIPEHWEVVKIKYLTNGPLIYGANEPAVLEDRNLPRYIRITDLKSNGELKKETFKSLTREKAVPYMLKKGDLLFARSGATVGKVYLHKTNEPACFAGYLIRFRGDSKKINEKYLYYFMQSSSYKAWIKLNTVQATIQNVSAEKYRNLLIPKLKIEEQMKIVTHLDKVEKQIQETIAIIKEQVLKLESYRRSLIYEAVTGKIDVREMVDEIEQ